MPVIQGLVSPTGTVIRRRGQFQVIAKSATILEVEITGQNVTRAFVLATPWRNDGDIGPAPVSASPKPGANDRMLFALDGYYGLSFRIET
ncbi:MAG TPA: hypothetical protein VJ725_14315 [Thermoanaerobaculia bacterium]|nr:hypothetical protein [Thermoanaerobaculia bacterium]